MNNALNLCITDSENNQTFLIPVSSIVFITWRSDESKIRLLDGIEVTTSHLTREALLEIGWHVPPAPGVPPTYKQREDCYDAL